MAQAQMNLDYPDGATPLDANELEGLIPEHIVNRAQLDELEQANIAHADAWTNRARIKTVTSEGFLKRLHKEMFRNVWRWAGHFRTTEKNIGVAPHQIAPRLRDLCADVTTWIQRSSYGADEVAARFHHRLVFIHCFSNGNGRHARMATELLQERELGKERFTWGGANLNHPSAIRAEYIAALQAADHNDYERLLNFVRS